MGPVEHGLLAPKENTHAGSAPLRNLRTHGDEKPLDVGPSHIGADRILEDRRKSPAVFRVHNLIPENGSVLQINRESRPPPLYP